MQCIICGTECNGKTCSGACRAKMSRRTRNSNIERGSESVRLDAHAHGKEAHAQPEQTNPDSQGEQWSNELTESEVIARGCGHPDDPRTVDQVLAECEQAKSDSQGNNPDLLARPAHAIGLEGCECFACKPKESNDDSKLQLPIFVSDGHTQLLIEQPLDEQIREAAEGIAKFTPRPPMVEPTVKSLSRTQLISRIRSYSNDTWINSPEYNELMRRLKAWSIEKLEGLGYHVPAWKKAG